jgi:uncharacterized protein DUF2188
VARGWVHTTYKGSQWHNVIEGGEVLSIHRTKDEAVEAGRNAARQRRTEHVVHNMDGTVGYRNSYGSDPFPPPN